MRSETDIKLSASIWWNTLTSAERKKYAKEHLSKMGYDLIHTPSGNINIFLKDIIEIYKTHNNINQL